MHTEIEVENPLADLRLVSFSTAECILCYITSCPVILMEATQLLHHHGLEGPNRVIA